MAEREILRGDFRMGIHHAVLANQLWIYSDFGLRGPNLVILTRHGVMARCSGVADSRVQLDRGCIVEVEDSRP